MDWRSRSALICERDHTGDRPRSLRESTPGGTLQMADPRKDETPRKFKFAMADRKGFRLHNYEQAVETMRSILAKKGICLETMPFHTAEHLRMAAAHVRGYERRRDRLRRHQEAAADLKLLIKNLKALSRAIRRAPASREALQTILEKSRQQFFDTELFAELIQSVHVVLYAKGDPDRDKWRDTSDLWEKIRPATRSAVEAELRRSYKTLEPSEFMRAMAKSLREFAPPRTRKTSVNYEFGLAMGKSWKKLGLTIGAFRYSANGSPFQSYCGAAVAAVGGNFTISRRQVERIRNELELP
jgi:hypothetical protein